MTPLWTRLFFTRQNEFRIVWLLVPAVLVQGIAANWYPPILEVVWDMVFYKGMAYGLHHFSSFNLQQHFPIPPLYPLIISPAFFASDYLTVECIQSWINPLVYFGGLYPTYYYARRLLDSRGSAWVCVLYVVYPSAAYTQWTMSECLAAPLVMWVMALAVRLLTDERPRMREGTWLGIAIACVALTRIFLVVLCVVVVLWIAYRTFRRNRYPAPIFMAFSLSTTLLITVWWQMGYLAYQGSSLVYGEFTNQPFLSLLHTFLTIFAAQGTGLWIEGGFAITLLILLKACLTVPGFNQEESPQRETAWVVFWILMALMIAVAVYNGKRIEIELWSVSLRHIFYGNLIGLPLVVSMAGMLRNASVFSRVVQVLLLLILISLFGIGLLFPESCMKLRDSHAFFTNAPSLDCIYWIEQENNLDLWMRFAGISFLVGGLILWTRRVGLVVLILVLFFIQFCAVNHIQFTRQRALGDQHITHIHDFCHELQAGKWDDLMIYCEESEQRPHLKTNLFYWVRRGARHLLPENPRPTPPYLLLTVQPTDYPDGEPVFESGKLRAYLFEK